MLRDLQTGNATNSSYEIITTTPRVVMAVTPHPDDCEGGCGATLAKWVEEAGTEVIVVMCTNGNKGTGDREMTPERLAATREVEQMAASHVVGAKEVVFLRHPDGGLEDSRLFRSQVVREIRRHKPDLILCIDPYRSRSHTHRDHRMSGQVALDAAFTYAWSYLHFPEQITEEGLEPHMVEQAYMWGSESPDVFVEVGGYLDVKTRSLEAHASQMSPVTTAERLSRIAHMHGRHKEETGLDYAEAFRRLKFNMRSKDWQFLHT